MSDSATIGLRAREKDAGDGIALLDLLGCFRDHLKLLIGVPLAAGVFAFAASYLITPTFTARTSFLPPQQQQGGAAAALGQLGALGGLAGAAIGIKSPADQFVALMQSETVADRLIEQFDLLGVYDVKHAFEARKALSDNTRILVGKKDGLVVVEVDDHSPERSARIANQYVAELRRMSNELALTEAQQRRAFFEQQLKGTRDRLAQAQRTLQAEGFNPGALKAEPKAAADTYARLSAEVALTEVKLRSLRSAWTEGSPEVQQQQATLDALRAQLSRLESPKTTGAPPGTDYVGNYREYKYQEALFELFSRQYEVARIDESREGTLIQVIDVARVPESKTRPHRLIISLVSTLAAFVILAIYVLLRSAWRPEENASHL